MRAGEGSWMKKKKKRERDEKEKERNCQLGLSAMVRKEEERRQK